MWTSDMSKNNSILNASFQHYQPRDLEQVSQPHLQLIVTPHGCFKDRVRKISVDIF